MAGINTHGGAGLLQSHGQDGDGVNPDECGQIHNEPLSQSWQVNTTSVTSSDIPSDSVSVAGINMHSGGGLLRLHGHGDHNITLEKHEQIHTEPLSQSWQVNTVLVTLSDIPSEDSVSVAGINMRGGASLLQLHCSDSDVIILEERE